MRQIPVPEPPGYFRWPRRRRLFLELGTGILIIAAIAIGNLPRWLEDLGWAAWLLWMISLSILYLRYWNTRRRNARQ